MSLHYEWVLSMRLRPDTPDEVIGGARFLLGLGPRPEGGLPREDPVFAVPPDERDPLPGGSVAAMRRQTVYRGRPDVWTLYVRAGFLDDTAYDLMLNVLPWFARWSLTQGWVGGMREEGDLLLSYNFAVQGRFACIAGPDGAFQPLDPQAPYFSLTWTGDVFPD